jgi:hypothetical protein
MEYDVGTYISFAKPQLELEETSLLVCWFSPGTKFIYDTLRGSLSPQTM